MSKFPFPKADENNERLVKLTKAKFVIEATDAEQFLLWCRNKETKAITDWKEDSLGVGYTIGTLDTRPVCISLRFAELDGLPVVFFSMTSQVEDHVMAEEWIKHYCYPKYARGQRRAWTDAMNFGQVKAAIDEHQYDSMVAAQELLKC